MAQAELQCSHDIYSTVVIAHANYMEDTLWLGSDRFDREHEALCILAAKYQTSYRRQYRVEYIYNQTHETKYLADLSDLLCNAHRWRSLCVGSKSQKQSCVAFRLLSGCEGATSMTLSDSDSVGYPNKAYFSRMILSFLSLCPRLCRHWQIVILVYEHLRLLPYTLP